MLWLADGEPPWTQTLAFCISVIELFPGVVSVVDVSGEEAILKEEGYNFQLKVCC